MLLIKRSFSKWGVGCSEAVCLFCLCPSSVAWAPSHSFFFFRSRLVYSFTSKVYLKRESNFFFFLGYMGFELRALGLQDCHSTT
jgi:hypothetical protein